MKGIALTLGTLLLFATGAEAGWNWNKEAYRSAKSSMVEQRTTSPSFCYDSGFEFSGFASGFWPEGNAFDNALGGGVSLAYFFGRNLGLELDYMAHGGGTSQQVGHFNAVYRLPLGGECCATIAPYFFGGLGMVSVNENEMLWNIGGGLDFRLESWGCVGLFADFSYNFVDDAVIPDFTVVRAGFRVPF
jgi:hypothetical protein